MVWIVASSLRTKSISTSCVAVASLYGMIEMLCKLLMITEFIRENNIGLFAVTFLLYVLLNSISIWYNFIRFSITLKTVKSMGGF